MTAIIKKYKYTGKGGAEAEVESIGFKRIDSTVAGSQDAPVDDRGDAVYYSIYTPDGDGITTSSYEAWVRFGIGQSPDNHVSNFRLWTDDDEPDDVNAPVLMVGMTSTYRKPTNAVSDIAVNNIYSYSEDTPLYITRAGLSGYQITNNITLNYTIIAGSFSIGDVVTGGTSGAIGSILSIGTVSGVLLINVTNGQFVDSETITSGTNSATITNVDDVSYRATVADTGSGNVYFLNGLKQDSPTLIIGNDIYTITNTSGASYSMSFYETDNTPILPLDGTTGITVANQGTNNEIITINTTVLSNYISGSGNDLTGFKYDFDNAGTPSGIGSIIALFDPVNTSFPNITYNHVVDVVDSEFVITFDSSFDTGGATRKPVLNFTRGERHVFTNNDGSSHPFRIHLDESGSEDNVVVNGIVVENGGTDGEIITVDVSQLFDFLGPEFDALQSDTITVADTSRLLYGSTKEYETSYGNAIIDVGNYTGTYNMIDVGDKTDFIVFQVQVTENTSAGNYIPNIRVAYDEA